MAQQKRDYYETLGLSRGASSDEIKKAYRKLARQYHPDINNEDGAEEQFKEVAEAYEVLSDAQRRQRYDQFGHAAEQNGGGPSGDPFGGGFGGFSGGSPFGDIFDTFFGGARSSGGRRGPSRGADLETTVELTFEEAVFGADKDLELERLEACEDCDGAGTRDGSAPQQCPVCHGAGEVRRVQNSIFGRVMSASPCSNCNGTGSVIKNPCFKCQGSGRFRRERTISVTIPAGIDEDSTLRLNGQGEQMPDGIPGNLYVNVRILRHEYFRRDGQMIHVDVPVNFVQAALGTEVEIPTVDGPVVLSVQRGTQPGQQYRLKGKGVPGLRNGQRGDQIVTVRVMTPTELTSEQEELLEQLGASLNEPDLQETHRKGFMDHIRDAASRFVHSS